MKLPPGPLSGGHAYKGMPKALLGHAVALEHKRPVFPDYAPHAYVALAQRCWDGEPTARWVECICCSVWVCTRVC